MEEEDTHGRRSQEGVRRSCSLGVSALEEGGKGSLSCKKRESNHGGGEVGRLHDWLVLDEREDESSVCTKEEDKTLK